MVDVDVVLVLPAARVEPLPEVALVVIQPDADERNAEIGCALDVIARENAEAARVDRNATRGCRTPPRNTRPVGPTARRRGGRPRYASSARYSRMRR